MTFWLFRLLETDTSEETKSRLREEIAYLRHEGECLLHGAWGRQNIGMPWQLKRADKLERRLRA